MVFNRNRNDNDGLCGKNTPTLSLDRYFSLQIPTSTLQLQGILKNFKRSRWAVNLPHQEEELNLFGNCSSIAVVDFSHPSDQMLESCPSFGP